MQSLTLEQAILETARSLSLDKQQTLLDFAEFLAQRSEAASVVETGDDDLQVEDSEVEA